MTTANDMFCFQCQETAKGTGCTIKGVCGKTSTTARWQDLLLSVVRGVATIEHALVEAGEPIDQQAASFMVDALFTTITNANFDEDSIRARVWLLTLSMQMRFLRTMKKLMLSSSLLWLRHWTTA